MQPTFQPAGQLPSTLFPDYGQIETSCIAREKSLRAYVVAGFSPRSTWKPTWAKARDYIVTSQHSKGLPCDLPTDVFPPVCDQILAISKPNNSILIGSRNVTMAQIAAAITVARRLGRPLVDQTGLASRFDFTLEWIRESDAPAPADLQEGTIFQEALQEQLGLRLRSTKVSVDTLVIDHVERPSEN